MVESSQPTPNLAGKTCVITGATSGIGLATATSLARLGARVILVGRNPARCESARTEISRETGNDNVEALVADLSSQAEVRRLADELRSRVPRMDVLINNAGAMFVERRESVDGIEKTWALNHLAYFLLTNLLLDRLTASAPARVICVASGAHKMVKGIQFDDVQFQKRYKFFRVYAHSKLANILFTFELARRLKGTGVTANALHPGFVFTRIFEGRGRIYWQIRMLARLLATPVTQGAETPVYLASSPEVETTSGCYFEKKKSVPPSKAALDGEAARRLWTLSEEMTGKSVMS
jgi:NAD(P)-dependent dehydrogenase (short-subunit alcohol dehydrogenase family)